MCACLWFFWTERALGQSWCMDKEGVRTVGSLCRGTGDGVTIYTLQYNTYIARPHVHKGQTLKGRVHDGQTFEGCVHGGQIFKGCVHGGQTFKGCVVYIYNIYTYTLENLKVISYEQIIIPINKITPPHIISLRELKHLTIHSSMCSQ